MPFAAGEKLLAVLALIDQAFELAHLLREPAAIIFVLEIECEAIAADLEVRRILGKLRVRIAVEDQPIRALMRR
jgi:hypothetical protein